MDGMELDKKKDDLIRWKTDAWKDPGMVAWYSRQMVENTGTTRLKNYLETALCERFAAGERILDVGVGTGRASLPLARKGFRVTGVDSSQAMLDEFRRLAGKTPVEARLGDVTDLPVGDDSFDTVMALNVVTHFPHWRSILGEWKKKVRSGGRMLFDIYSLDHIGQVSGRAVSEEEMLAGNDMSSYNTHIRVEDLVACADELGLTVVAVVPYGGLFAGKRQDYFSGRVLVEQNWWQRHLTWIASDDRFFDFCVFMEEQFFGVTTSMMTGRFFVVLENQPDPAANKSWLARNKRLNASLAIGPQGGWAPMALEGGDLTAWKRQLNAHLDTMRARVVFFFLWMSIWQGDNAFTTELLEQRHRDVFEDWKAREMTDMRAFDLACGWYKQAEISAILDFQGMPLGLGGEYEMTRILLRDCFHAFD